MTSKTRAPRKRKGEAGKALARKLVKAKAARDTNPLLGKWRTPFAIAPFDQIEARHFEPAMQQAFRENRAEIRAIVANPAKPSFANTIVALEKSGVLLHRVAAVFWNIEGSCSTDELREISRRVSPLFAAHSSAILLDARLFKRVDELFERRDTLKLDDEQRRLLERTHLEFVRAGAKLKPKEKKRVAEINGRLASLVTQFMQNVLKDEQSWHLELDGERDLAGLPPGLRSSAAREAAARGLEGRHVITLSRSSVEPFLTFSTRRDLREKAFNAWVRRGANDGPTDNRAILAEIVALRGEYARLLGYRTYAEFSLDDTMAKTPEAVGKLLGDVWSHARRRAGEEREVLAEAAREEGSNAPIAAWDWRHYADKVRRKKFDLDDAELRPYLQLDNVISAAFDCAHRLFGLTFVPRDDIPRYHPDVRAWEVLDRKKQHVGLFLGDYFARPSKRSGAWMSSFRSQHKLGKGQRPIIVNVMNFAEGGEGEATLLSFDDARTLFHEFGHGLHGLLSDVTYPSLSGTSVSRDFVELPSQLYEHWLLQPEVLQKFAVHHQTGKPISARLIKRLKAARNFNQGFATVEFTASALADMKLYGAAPGAVADIETFEGDVLAEIGMPDAIVMRHRLPHFMHIVSGYAAGYYSYMWSEVMDADAFGAFEEAGDIFDRKTADRLKRHIYSAGNRRDPQDAYVAFRGRPPSVEGLMKNRGFTS
ncbi:MAG: M3 family metallopeptidase [Hyphomicrobiaceae bacterium]|nr:M3 family metallopeptidase [Hyphomicrobiaceae bacterium]